jgi:hypothetical protein
MVGSPLTRHDLLWGLPAMALCLGFAVKFLTRGFSAAYAQPQREGRIQSAERAVPTHR